jgi:hypothetical protein
MIYCHIRTACDGDTHRRCDLALQYCQIAHRLWLTAPHRDAPPKGLCWGSSGGAPRLRIVVHVVSGHARTANDHIGSLDGGGFAHKTTLSAFTHPLVCAGHNP